MAPASAELLDSVRTTLARMEHTLGVLSEAIVWTDATGAIQWCNPAFARLASRPALALIGRPVDQVLVLSSGGHTVAAAEHPVRRAMAANRPVVDAYLTDRGGQSRHLEVYAACLRGAAGDSAMMVIRDNTERFLAESWLEAESARSELVRAVAAASNEAEEPKAALESALKLVCRFLGWPVGHAAIPGAAGVWHLAGGGAGRWQRFVEASSPAGMAADGLVDAVSAWDPALRPDSPRMKAAAECGLRAALAFPVKSDRGVEAVAEFHTTEETRPDPELFPVLEQIGVQLGRVFERRQTRLSLMSAQQDLALRVEERTAELTSLNRAMQEEIARRETFQAALRDAMDRYRSLVQSVRDAIFSLSPSGRVESLNQAFDTLTGRSSRHMVAKRLLPLVHARDRRLAVAAFERTLAGEVVEPFEIRIRQANGDWIFVECSLTLQTKPGHAPRVAGIARDVTERRRARAELMVRDRAMAASTEGILITDSRQPGNPITFVNSGFERLTGYAAPEAIGRSLDLLRGPDTDPSAMSRLEEAIAQGNPITIEMRSHRADGQSLWTRMAATPVRDGDGRPANYVAILSDISAHKEAERLKNDLVAAVSHELRTPLTSLRGLAELMLERDYPPDKQKKFVQIIHRESTRLSNLINDFLDVQKMEAGRQEYHFSKVPLRQILRDTAALFGSTSPLHRFEIECPDGLPEVRADVDRLRQITTNLMSNAVKFSPKGGRVTLEARREGPLVVVSVSDEGIGIPAGALGKLFQKFYRVDNAETRKIGGTGLGLSIVKQIVDGHGGRIWVESKPGEGTRVLFTLPVFA